MIGRTSAYAKYGLAFHNANTLEEFQSSSEVIFTVIELSIVSMRSQSRTQMACFSQNDYSEEVIKTTHHLCSLEANAEHEEPKINDEQPTGLERNDNDYHALVISHAKGLKWYKEED